MAAQMVTNVPRILSTILSFWILYFPGFLACSILLTQILFTKTSDILFLFLTLLAGTSLTVSSHLVASFFSKAQLAGLYTSVLAFALALIILVYTLTSTPSLTQVIALAAVFPPITWATLVSDVVCISCDKAIHIAFLFLILLFGDAGLRDENLEKRLSLMFNIY